MPSCRFLSPVVAPVVLTLFAAGCAARSPQRGPVDAPPAATPAAAASSPSASDAGPSNEETLDAYAVLEAQSETYILVAQLPRDAAAAGRSATGRSAIRSSRSIDLGGRKLDVRNERRVDAPATFTLVGHARDARCVTRASARAIVHLADSAASYDAYRVTPCAGTNSFFALRGAHEGVEWIQPNEVDIQPSAKGVRAANVTLDGVDAQITALTTVHRDRRCTHAMGFSVSMTSPNGNMLDIAGASVRGAVTVGSTTIIFLFDPRNPGIVQGVRVARGHAERVFRAEVDNHQDGVDCLGS